MSNGLPPGISGILEYLAQAASGYGNRLKWNEVDKLKADLMNVPARWREYQQARSPVAAGRWA
jgi:hypothetical protein